jgi:hypothetical protein
MSGDDGDDANDPALPEPDAVSTGAAATPRDLPRLLRDAMLACDGADRLEASLTAEIDEPPSLAHVDFAGAQDERRLRGLVDSVRRCALFRGAPPGRQGAHRGRAVKRARAFRVWLGDLPA